MAITLVQSTSVGSTGSGSSGSIQVAFGANNAAGNLLTLGAYSNSSGFTSTVTDSAGNTWVLQIHSTSGQTETLDIWRSLSAAGGSNTVTIDYSNPAAVFNQVHLAEWNDNSAGTWSIASTGQSSGASTVAAPGSLSPSPSTVLFVVWYGNASAYVVTSSPTGYSSVSAGLSRSEVWFKTVSSTSTENPALTFNATENWKAGLIAFASTSAAGGAATGVRLRRLAALGAG